MLASNFPFRHAAGAFCAAACLLLAPQVSHAQAFTISFSPAMQSVLPSSSVTFRGSITNTTSSPLYISGDAVDPLVAGLTTDDTPFQNTFLNAAPVLLGAGQTYALTELFTVTDTNAAVGTYTGQFDIYGGSDPSATDQSGFQTFTVSVPQAVPESSTSASLGLLLGGAGLMALRRRKGAAV